MSKPNHTNILFILAIIAMVLGFWWVVYKFMDYCGFIDYIILFLERLRDTALWVFGRN